MDINYNKITKLIIIFIGYLVVMVITTWPVCLNLSKPIGPPEDNQMFIWNLWWFKYAIFNLHVNPFTTNYLFYPQGQSLYFHTYSCMNGVIGILLQSFCSIIVTYNILVLLTLLIGAIGAFMLFKYLGLSFPASFIGGLIYSFNPFHLTHLTHHLNISSIHLIPFLLIFTMKFMTQGKFQNLILAAVFLSANLYLDPYIFLFSIIIIIFLPLVNFNPSNSVSRFKQLYKITAIIIIGTCLSLPLLIPMASEVLRGSFRTLPGHDQSGVDLVSFFFPYRDHWTRSSPINYIINLSYKSTFWESAAFLGYLVFPMAIWSIIRVKYFLKTYIIVIGIIGAILSLGSFPHVFGMTIPYIKLPMYFIKQIPGLNAARSPSRFIFLTYFSISVAAAYALNVFFHHLKSRYKYPIYAAGIGLLSLSVMADYSAIPIEFSEISIPGSYRQIANETEEFAILNLPQSGWDNNERYMYHQTIHQKPICNGQLARSGDEYFEEWKNVSLDIPSLTERKVKYIVLYSEFLEPRQYLRLKQKLTQDLQFIDEDNGVSLFRVF